MATNSQRAQEILSALADRPVAPPAALRVVRDYLGNDAGSAEDVFGLFIASIRSQVQRVVAARAEKEVVLAAKAERAAAKANARANLPEGLRD